MRQITSSTLSNQSLATALLCHTYTADADRDIFFRLFADQVAGNGAYSAYITIQRLGAGSAYEVQPRTAPTVASGVTAIAFTTVTIPVKNTDVVKVYLLGLAGDTTTPDIVTEVWEADYSRPLTAGQYGTSIDSSGRVLLQPTQTGVTIPTVTDVTNSVTATVSDKTGFSLSSAGVQAIWDALTSALTTVGSIGKLLVDRINATISSRAAAGDEMSLTSDTITAIAVAVESGGMSAPILYTYTAKEDDNVTPIADVWVGAYTHASMSNAYLAQVRRTNAFGVATFDLDEGTWHFRRVKFGYSFENPDEEIVS